MRRRTTSLTILGILALVGGAVAQATAAINVNGDLSDWGITLDVDKHLLYDAGTYDGYTGDQPAGSTTSKWGTGTFGGVTIRYHLEDSDDDTDALYRVDPLYGGQNFDAQALVVAHDDSTLYIGIASGQRPDNANPDGDVDASYYGPGDLLIMTLDNTTYPNQWEKYGVEVGGGPGAPDPFPSPAMVEDGDPGWTYELNGSGYTESSSKRDDANAGSLWRTSSFSDDWIQGNLGHYTQLQGGEYVGLVDYAFNFDKSLGQHSFIEMAIPYHDPWFDAPVRYVRWSPACFNDEVYLCVTLPPPAPVPEPASLVVWALLALGCGGSAWWRSRRGRRREAA